MQEKPEFANSEQEDAPNNLFNGSVPMRAALHELRMRTLLLDLTSRNRLLNFKHSADKSLQFVQTSIDAAFQHIKRIKPVASLLHRYRRLIEKTILTFNNINTSRQ